MSSPAVLRLTALFGLLLCPHEILAVNAQDLQPEQELFEAIDRNRSAHLEFLQSLIRAQPDGEAVQALVAARLRELGLEVETLRLVPTSLSLNLEFAAEETIDKTERTSALGRLPGTGSGRSMLFFAHPDGEPVTDASLEGWEHDPFAAEVENGRLCRCRRYSRR